MKKANSVRTVESIKGKTWIEDDVVFMDQYVVANVTFPESEGNYSIGKLRGNKFVSKDFTLVLEKQFKKERPVAVCLICKDGIPVIFHRQDNLILNEEELRLADFKLLFTSTAYFEKTYYLTAYPIESKIPQLSKQIFKVTGDGKFNVNGFEVQTNANLRCAGSCEFLLVFDAEGKGVAFLK